MHDLDMPDDHLDSLFMQYAVLMLAKGATVTPADVHNAWVAWMTSVGKVHEAMIPYESLSPEAKAKDEPFADAIRTVALHAE